MDYKTTIEQVDKYIEMHASEINHRYRHMYHMMPPVGWMNDPNGFCLYRDKYHMFYQFYPYDSCWGPMFWGHVTSSNFMDWQIQPTALAPGNNYDKHGVFSGSAIEVDGEMRLYYTGHSDQILERKYDKTFQLRDKILTLQEVGISGVKQVQCLAVSKDGISFEKKGEVVGSELVRCNGRIEDFRDPKVWKYGDKYYMVCGSKSVHYRAQVLFYVSDDGKKWEYLNYFSLGKEYGTIWECPDLFKIDGQYVLIVSPQGKPSIRDTEFEGEVITRAKLENFFSTVAFIGSFDHETGQFSVERTQDIDYGFDFYAPQSMEDAEGNRVLMAWMNMWMRETVLHNFNHGWNGSMTIPRNLSIHNKHIFQYPIDAVKDYRVKEMSVTIDSIKGDYGNNCLSGDSIDMELEFDMLESEYFSIDLFKGVDNMSGNKEGLKLSFNKTKDEVTLDRSASTMINESKNINKDYTRNIHVYLNRPIKLRVLLDVSSCEIFINDGEYTMTTLFYKAMDKSEMHFQSRGKTKINRLVKWDMRKSIKYD